MRDKGLAATDGDRQMSETKQIDATRVFWDGGEVAFIRWTEKALVFSWDNQLETAIHMPRGAVLRLMQKGVLQIEGDMPPWTGSLRVGGSTTAPNLQEKETSRPEMATGEARVERSNSMERAHRSAQDARSASIRVVRPIRPLGEIQTEAPGASRSLAPESPDANRLSIVKRLIRKLTGGDPHPSAEGIS
jgi:hypothetical protein